MDARLKKPVVTISIAIVLLTSMLVNVKTVFPNGVGGKIDLFTQQEPYSGKGANIQSDAFGPGDLVFLYALVTYNNVPQQNLIVTFYVQSPDNSSFYLTEKTNESGISTVNFTIPHKCVNESEVFGEWFVQGNARIDGDILQDTLTFRVDWIVKLLSVRTLDDDLNYQAMFGVEGDVGLEVKLRNIAMVEKNATLAMVVQDESFVPVSSFSIHNFEVQPNEKTVVVYFRLFLPKWARVGMATVYVSALTASAEESGVPYCPEVSTEFYIWISEPLTIDFHDASIIKVVPSSTSVKRGELVYIDVKVRNEGTNVESFNVSTYYENTLIGTLQVMNLTPYSSLTLSFIFDTSAVNLGNYTITAFIPYLTKEADYSDNLFVDGIIEVRAARQYYLTVRTDPLDVTIIAGEGWYDEESNVTLNAPEYVSVLTGVRYKFSHWDTDGTPNSDNPITVTMNANHTATAHYILQYYLTVVSPYGSVGGEGWYNVNTTAYATLNIDTIDHGNNTRRVFVNWGGDASGTHFMQSNDILMDRPKTVVANWKTQYHLTVRIDPPGIVTIPGEGWYDEGSNVTLTAPEYVSVSTGVRYKFAYWNVDETSNSSNSIVVTMNVNYTATAHYTLQYYLTVRVDPSGIVAIPGEGWYNEMENVALTALPVEEYDFGYWDVDGASKGDGVNTITVTMNSPHTATAHYNTQVRGWYVPWWSLFWFLLLPLLLILALIIALLYRRRKKKKTEETFYRGWTAWYYQYNLRNKTRKI